MMDDYDVEDDLPQNIPTVGPETTKSIPRISKKMMKEQGEKSIRKPRPKLDFNRLLKGSRGLGYLAVCTQKNLKLTGKVGGEANDLSQICVYLQEWAKLVFPKMPLMEFLLKVEDICQSKIMKDCVPQILARIKEMGENVDLNDLEGVESEIMAKIATKDAERAMESISASPEKGKAAADSATTTTSSTATGNIDLDFDLAETLALNRSKYYKRERSENIASEDSEDDDEDESYYEKELEGFINDDEEDENEIDSSPKKLSSPASKEIPFNFNDESSSDIDEYTNTSAVAVAVDTAVSTTTTRKNRNIIMESDEE